MVIFKVIEFVLIFVSVIVIATQIIYPAVVGRQMFPLFKKQGKLESEIVGEKQRAAERKLETELKSLKKGNK